MIVKYKKWLTALLIKIKSKVLILINTLLFIFISTIFMKKPISSL